MPHPEASQTPIATFLHQAELAPRQAHKALTVWPLVWPEGAAPSGPACVPLREALARGSVRVDEVNDGGSVPHVRLENAGKEPVLFLFGEEIVGAKQNRVANATFLVPAKSSVVIDVSCVEAGRWGRRARRGFHETRELLSSAMRRKMQHKVSLSLGRGLGFQADQGEVWDDIGARLIGTTTCSDTSAYGDYRESRKNDLSELERTFHALPRQVGFVALVGERVVGLEALGRPEVFAASFDTLLRSYTIDAVDAGLLKQLERDDEQRGASFDAPEPFLAALASAPATLGRSLGLGSDLRVATKQVSACALACEGLVHLTAFPAEGAA